MGSAVIAALEVTVVSEEAVMVLEAAMALEATGVSEAIGGSTPDLVGAALAAGVGLADRLIVT